jgi:hypothetical protein
MKSLKANDHLVKDTPYVFFFHIPIAFLEVVNFRLKITSICELHDNIKSLSIFFEECLFVRNNIRVIDRGKYSDFIQGILFLLESEIVNVNLLHCIDLSIGFPFSFENS